MGRKIKCPNCQTDTNAEWVEKQKQFKVEYSESLKKYIGRHLFMLPVHTRCGACLQPVIITTSLSEKLFCPCRTKTNLFVASESGEERLSKEWIRVRLESVQRSVDCGDTWVRCSNCSHDMLLSTVVGGGKTLGTREDRIAAFDRLLEENERPGGPSDGFSDGYLY